MQRTTISTALVTGALALLTMAPRPAASDELDLPRSPVKADEEVILFPTMARWRDGAWELPVHGWIYEPEDDDFTRRKILEGLEASLELSRAELDTPTFRDRIRAFLFDNERGKELPVRAHSGGAVIGPSDAAGHFEGVVTVVEDDPLAAAGLGSPVTLTIPERSGDRVFQGDAFLLEDYGLTLISDIDDTIKLSYVKDKAKLLRSTFLEPSRPVEGMAEVYTRWLAGPGDHLHFVSGSPWQLYPALAKMVESAGFPPATFSLRHVRFKDTSVLNLFGDPTPQKVKIIDDLIADHPRRRYVLVGDSGERDPEVYGAIARAHPTLVAAIFIRRAPGGDHSPARLHEAFHNLPPTLWTLFERADELPAQLP